MKISESKIFDLINLCIGAIQKKTYKIRQNSFILSNIDFLIFLAIVFTLVISTFAPTEIIGYVSISVPVLVVLKVLITKGEKIELEKANFFLLIYLLICLISNFTSSLIPQSLYGFMKTSIYFAFYFAVCQFLKNNKKLIVPLVSIIALLVSIESIIGVGQNIFGVESISTWQDLSYVNPEDVISRVYGTLSPYNPNLFAGWLIVSFPALLGISALLFCNIKEKTAIAKYTFIASVVMVLIALLTIFLTGCRGAYIALFVMFIAIAVASFLVVFKNKEYEKYKKVWSNTLASLSACAVGFLLVNQSILKRLLSIFILREDSSTSFRMNVYSSAVQMFQDNWIQGIGVGNKVFREIYGLYMLSGFDALSCYCIFLEIAVESGIFALIAFILFLGSLFGANIKTFMSNKDLGYKILLSVSFIAVLGAMVHGFVDTVYFRPQVQFVFWIMAAISVVLTREEKIQ